MAAPDEIEPDHYRVLEVHSEARVEVIEAAFVVLREIALSDESPEGTRRLVDLNHAHAVLTNPERRARHDAARSG